MFSCCSYCLPHSQLDAERIFFSLVLMWNDNNFNKNTNNNKTEERIIQFQFEEVYVQIINFSFSHLIDQVLSTTSILNEFTLSAIYVLNSFHLFHVTSHTTKTNEYSLKQTRNIRKQTNNSSQKLKRKIILLLCLLYCWLLLLLLVRCSTILLESRSDWFNCLYVAVCQCVVHGKTLTIYFLFWLFKQQQFHWINRIDESTRAITATTQRQVIILNNKVQIAKIIHIERKRSFSFRGDKTWSRRAVSDDNFSCAGYDNCC